MHLEKPNLPRHLGDFVVNGILDEMIPVSNSHRLSENLPNAVLLAYPDSGHGSLFQLHESFARHAAAFLASDSPFAALLNSYDVNQ
jgi:pimeloyl-ACP methyl ester carboxylesterase